MARTDWLDIANFDDRYTMRFVREYGASIDRVWRAVTTEELNLWLYPVSRIDARRGGFVSFTWGQPEHTPDRYKITKFEPPNLIRFASIDATDRVDHRTYLEFRLEPMGAGTHSGTRLTFTQRLSAVPEADRVDDDDLPKDAAFPGGPDAPWRPGTVAGFHLNMDALGVWTSFDWSEDKIRGEIDGAIRAADDGRAPETADDWAYGAGSPRWQQLVAVYYDYLARFLPSRRGVPPEDPAGYRGLAWDLANREESEVEVEATAGSPLLEQEHVVYIKTTPEALWQALTTADATMRYHLFVAVDSSFRKGAPIVYRRGDFEAVKGEIHAITKHKLLAYDFTHFGEENRPPSRVTYRLYQRGDIMKIKLTHEGLLDTKMYNRQMRWWTVILSSLKTLLETGEPLMLTYERA